MSARLLRIDQVSEATGVPIETLRWWRKRNKGEGPKSGRLGGRVVYYATDVEAWITEQLGVEEHAGLAVPEEASPQLRAV